MNKLVVQLFGNTPPKSPAAKVKKTHATSCSIVGSNFSFNKKAKDKSIKNIIIINIFTKSLKKIKFMV